MNSFIHGSNVYHFRDGALFCKGRYVGDFIGVKEAKEYLRGVDMSFSVEQSQSKKTISESTVALALYEHGEKRVNESIVSLYTRVVEQKKFLPSSVVLSLREQYTDSQFASKIDYVMADGSVVMIDLETNRMLNTILDIRESSDFILYMTKDSSTFLKCVNEILEDI